jgi:hypothetical protein
VKLTAKLIAAGMALLVAALFSSLAAMTIVSRKVVRNSTVIEAVGGPSSQMLASMLKSVLEGIRSINVTIRNIGASEVEVIYMAHVGSKVSSQNIRLKPGESVTLESRSLLDTVIVKPTANLSRVYLEVEATIVRGKLLSLGVVGLALFIAGSVLVSVGIMLRLSGLEVE